MLHRTCLLALLTTAPGCSWLGFGAAPDDDVEALKAEIDVLRTELAALREEVDVAHDVVVATPAPRATAQRADFDRLEGAVDDMAQLADAVDVDLELVEGQVQELLGRVSVAEAKIGSIEGILNNHADGIDDLSGGLAVIESETASLRPLNSLLYFDDGKIFVEGVDLVFKPAKNADGTPRSTGPVMVRPPIE